MKGNNRVTVALLGQKLEILTDMVDSHMQEATSTFKDIREALDGCDEYPGVRGRLLILEQTEKSRKRHFAYVWGGICALSASLVGVISLLPR